LKKDCPEYLSQALVSEITCSMEIPYHGLEKAKIKNSFVNSHNHYDNLYSNRKFTTWGIEDVLLKIIFSVHVQSSLLCNISNSVQLETV